jgi:hypothetical protein
VIGEIVWSTEIWIAKQLTSSNSYLRIQNETGEADAGPQDRGGCGGTFNRKEITDSRSIHPLASHRARLERLWRPEDPLSALHACSGYQASGDGC